MKKEKLKAFLNLMNAGKQMGQIKLIIPIVHIEEALNKSGGTPIMWLAIIRYSAIV